MIKKSFLEICVEKLVGKAGWENNVKGKGENIVEKLCGKFKWKNLVGKLY